MWVQFSDGFFYNTNREISKDMWMDEDTEILMCFEEPKHLTLKRCICFKIAMEAESEEGMLDKASSYFCDMKSSSLSQAQLALCLADHLCQHPKVLP